MGRATDDREQKARAASFFLARAQEAMTAADQARTEEAGAAFCKEAETWLYMASQCLNPAAAAARPEVLDAPPRRVGREPRSFGGD